MFNNYLESHYLLGSLIPITLICTLVNVWDKFLLILEEDILS